MIQAEAPRRWGPRSTAPSALFLVLIPILILTPRPTAAQARFVLPPLPIDTFTLANGLRVIVSEDHSDPLVAVSMWYHVGSADEAPGRTGFAHFFEHMLFEQTENMAEGEYDRLITEAGGVMNGATDTDRTAYWELLPANRLDLALWTQAERMHGLKVSDQSFRTVREVVKEERRQRVESQPYAAAQLAVDTLAMDYVPYRHPPIGSMDDLDAASADDARRFYQRWYVPNNAVLTVVGDVTTAEVRALVREYFGPIPRGEPAPAEPPFPATPRTSGERRLEVADPLAQLPLVWIAYNVPAADHRDAYALSLLSSIFSAGESSRLQQRLVQRESAALDVVAFLRTRAGPGTILFGAIPNLGVSVERVEQLVAEEIERLRTEGVTEQELAKAKNQQRASEVTGRMRVQTKADLLQGAELYHRDPFRLNGEMARFEAVTLADVRRVAETYLTEANRTVVIARPARPGN